MTPDRNKQQAFTLAQQRRHCALIDYFREAELVSMHDDDMQTEFDLIRALWQRFRDGDIA